MVIHLVWSRIGDIKQLQHEQLRKAQTIDYQTKPPLQVPSYLKNRDVDSLPGGVTFIDGQQGKIETAFAVNLNIKSLVSRHTRRKTTH